VRGLRDLGYIEGKNTVLTMRRATWPDPRMETFARELADSNVDIIITSCGWSTGSALKATKTIPIIMGAMHDPIGRGFIKSLARPGTNVTGSTGYIPDLGPKMMEYIRIAVPHAKVIGMLSNLSNPTHAGRSTQIQAAARAMDMSMVEIELQRTSTQESLTAALRSHGVQAMMVMPDDDFYYEYLDRIFPISEAMRLPTFFTKGDLVDLGATFAYGVDPETIFRRSAYYVDKVLNGADPAELPVEQPTKLEFAINVKKASAMGFEIPRAALMRADYLMK
jgi:putative tryptophan/tyrosine transport system substrate-binding protein